MLVSLTFRPLQQHKRAQPSEAELMISSFAEDAADKKALKQTNSALTQ